MDERGGFSLEERVAFLETEVRRLDRALASLQPATDEMIGGTSDRATEEVASFPDHTVEVDAGSRLGLGGVSRGRGLEIPEGLRNLRSGEWWLNKIGIGLLLFGVAFLFKFAVDQNWITPAVRVGIGLALGMGLLVIGLRVYEDRRSFSQVLLGGGIGTLYITGYAADVLYGLVPYAVAFAFMVAVTGLAFALALRQDEAVLSLIGTAGGLATPFILYAGSASVVGLVLYTCTILAGVAAVYLYKGWRTLLLVAFAGVWTVFFLGYASAVSLGQGGPADLRSLQAGVLFAWLALWLVPVGREVLRSRVPGRWPLPEPGAIARRLFGENVPKSRALAGVFSVVAPLLALAFTQGIWGLERRPLGWVALGLAAAHALIAVGLRRAERGGGMSYVQVLVALLLGTLALVLVLEGDALFVALAVEATVLHLVARRFSDRVVSWSAHALFGVIALWLGGRLAFGVLEATFGFGTRPPAFLNVQAFADLSAIVLAFAVSGVVAPRSAGRVYRIVAHAAVLGLILSEFLSLPNGASLALVSWAAYAAGLHLLSRRLPAWGTTAGADAAWIVIGLWLGSRLATEIWPYGSPETAVFDLRGICNLIVIALAIVSAFLEGRGSEGVARRAAYLLAAHVAVLAWLWSELSSLPSGDAYVTITWGLYAAGLLVAGLRLDHTQIIRAGMATLFLVVAKLFLVDLAEVEAVWRILLFIGFGGLFLVLSYYLQAVWRPGAASARRNDSS
jgi:uncharacterized membrane protein